MPDLLSPITATGIIAKNNLWQAFYIELIGLPAGTHKIQFSIFESSGELLGEFDYTLYVLDKALPDADLVCTYWLHFDCIAEYYGCPVFSERFNALFDSFLRSAVEHGLTMLLTPIFTPALDTCVGGERMTVQLVCITKAEERYDFDFSRLEWFMRFAEERGVKYFEMAHLFTQWGAKYAPKIVADVNGTQKRIFGWDTEALSTEYKAFLSQFLPELRSWLIEKGYYNRCYFHISDEPNQEIFDQYKKCSDFVKKYLFDAKFVDAMSHYEYYEKKIVDLPFVGLDATDTFIEKDAQNYFVYYCTAQRNRFVSNRFLSMPLERIRIIGMQMYINNVRGFLHWGYNFYHSVLSKESVDPFAVTDALGGLQSGDAFVVYPGKEGVLESVRNEAFLQGLQDFKALRLLESFIGREKVCAMLEENGIKKNFTDYPKNALWLISLRKKINEQIKKFL